MTQEAHKGRRVCPTFYHSRSIRAWSIASASPTPNAAACQSAALHPRYSRTYPRRSYEYRMDRDGWCVCLTGNMLPPLIHPPRTVNNISAVTDASACCGVKESMSYLSSKTKPSHPETKMNYLESSHPSVALSSCFWG
jgi:hypothetical protein